MSTKTVRIKINYNYTYENLSLKSEPMSIHNKYCKDYPDLPTIIPAHKRIIAIGDTHGDYDTTIKILKLAKLIDNNLNWIAEPKDTIVVQVGDQIDRCRPYIHECIHENATVDDEASDIKILKLFTDLHTKALKKGGAVYSLLGNHEIMNSQGKLGYVSKKGLDEFSQYYNKNLPPEKRFKPGWDARTFAFKPGNELGKFLACTRQSAIIVGSFLFVHAGIVPQLLEKYNITKRDDIHLINKAIKMWLLGLIDESKIDKLLNDHTISPFWPRLLGNMPTKLSSNHKDCKQLLDPVLETLKINGMIIGHTPQFYVNNIGINGTCDNKLWRTDHGSSRAFANIEDFFTKKDRSIQVLEINDNKTMVVLQSSS